MAMLNSQRVIRPMDPAEPSQEVRLGYDLGGFKWVKYFLRQCLDP